MSKALCIDLSLCTLAIKLGRGSRGKDKKSGKGIRRGGTREG